MTFIDLKYSSLATNTAQTHKQPGAETWVWASGHVELSGPPVISMARLSIWEKAALCPAPAVLSLNITAAELNSQGADPAESCFSPQSPHVFVETDGLDEFSEV